MKPAIDWSPLVHGVIAALIMGIVGLLTGHYIAGACLGAGFFLGREHAQAEYRWMDWQGAHRSGREALGAFDPEVWNLGSIFDLLVPMIPLAALIIANKFFSP